jgi:hypothetical protein
MRFYAAITAMTSAMLLLGSAVGSLPALAQYDQYGPPPAYATWQPGWDQYHYDRYHVILGTVQGFSPYRLTLLRRNGNVQTIDLKNGTIILPTGATPTQGERVAIVGYYSNGTFIANRLIIHP